MENEEMSKADLIAMLVSIREVARTNGEIHKIGRASCRERV